MRLFVRGLLPTLTLLLCAYTFVLPAQAQDQPQVFRGATVYPISAPPVENGVVVVQNGIIQAIGAEGEVEIPQAAVVHDMSGRC